MKTNWLWDSTINEREVKGILGDENHPKFYIYAEKLFSRISDPSIAFTFVDKKIFCSKWPGIKKRLKKDSWARNKVIFWQTMYEHIYKEFKKQGIKIREHAEVKIPQERKKIAKQIRTVREKLGYTQKDLAKRLGVIQQYISKIETGMENVSIDTLRRIANALGRKLTVRLG